MTDVVLLTDEQRILVELAPVPVEAGNVDHRGTGNKFKGKSRGPFFGRETLLVVLWAKIELPKNARGGGQLVRD